MADVRTLLPETMDAITPLLRHPRLEPQWSEPSVLPGMSTGALAGHLIRAMGVVTAYLDRPAPDEAPANPVHYYTGYVPATTQQDLDSEMYQAVRRIGDEAASAGYAALLDEWDATRALLPGRLAAEPADRLIRSFQGTVLTLDDFLSTRLVEACVHSDDLAAGLGLPTVALPPAALARVVDLLLGVCRERNGDAAVLRALTRHERDAARALRAL